MTTPRQHTSNTGETLFIIVLSVVFGAALATYVGGQAASLLTGHGTPAHGTITSGFAAFTHAGDPSLAWNSPMPPAWAYWLIEIALLVVVVVVAYLAWRLFQADTAQRRSDPHNLPGLAVRADVQRHASEKALLKRAANVRPSLEHPDADEIGYNLGRSRGISVWASVEDSMVLLGPPRSGKGLHIVIPMILDAPGAVITTSTRPDNLEVTMKVRKAMGPVGVFDPQQLAPGVPSAMKWSPIRGCADPQTAMVRARALAASSSEGIENGGFWLGQTEACLRAFLQAAALGDRQPIDLYRWSLDHVAAREVVAILRDNSSAVAGWADGLSAIIESDARSRDNVWSGVRIALSCLADPRVLASVSPSAGEMFDPVKFLRSNGTLYMMGTASGAGATSALIAAFIEDVTDVARRMAAASPGGRLDPPLSLILDEAANYVLPSLPELMSAGGGSGIATLAVIQSLAQARDKWKEQPAAAIWDAAIVKIVLGGQSNASDLENLSKLIGNRDDQTVSVSRDASGGRSTSTQLRTVPIMDPARVREMPFGTGVLMLRTAKPMLLDLIKWSDRRDNAALNSDKAELNAVINATAMKRLNLN